MEASGQVLDELRSRGFGDQNTIVIVVADHGEEFADHEGMLHSHTLYDELLQVPMVMRGLGIQSGARVRTQVRLIDIAPTILDKAGVGLPETHGETLAPILAEPHKAHADRNAISVRDRKYISIRSGREKLVVRYDAYPIAAALTRCKPGKARPRVRPEPGHSTNS